MSETWKGWNLDIWAPLQTLHKPLPKQSALGAFTGWEYLTYIPMDMPNIPLDVRYSHFCKRLDRALSK